MAREDWHWIDSDSGQVVFESIVTGDIVIRAYFSADH